MMISYRLKESSWCTCYATGRRDSVIPVLQLAVEHRPGTEAKVTAVADVGLAQAAGESRPEVGVANHPTEVGFRLIPALRPLFR